jgi:hypothetical protein
VNERRPALADWYAMNMRIIALCLLAVVTLVMLSMSIWQIHVGFELATSTSNRAPPVTWDARGSAVLAAPDRVELRRGRAPVRAPRD